MPWESKNLIFPGIDASLNKAFSKPQRAIKAGKLAAWLRKIPGVSAALQVHLKPHGKMLDS